VRPPFGPECLRHARRRKGERSRNRVARRWIPPAGEAMLKAPVERHRAARRPARTVIRSYRPPPVAIIRAITGLPNPQ